MKTILVVEDEKNLRQLYQQELQDEGYQVLTAENGTTAMDLVERESIDLAIIDIKMEGMNGIELLKHILEGHKNIKTVLNSAYTCYRSDFSTWCADAYLIKSSDLNELKIKIAELLSL